MKAFRYVSLLIVGLMCSSCLTTLLTVASAPQKPVTTTVVSTPATVVTTPQPVVYSTPAATTTTVRTSGHTTSTTVKVNAMTTDISLHLDLQAVAAAFAQSESVEEFEMILNSSRYMISNLDLNHDGYIDYLRVMEVMNSYNHVFVIQSVLAYNVFQNVATITVEMGATPYFQIIGDPYVYGTNYIVQPVFVRNPPLYTVFRRTNYVVWQSPYYWGYLPSYYSKPAPQYLSHYQAYVNTYMRNHKYCHEVTYPTVVHYTNYITVIQNVSRNDYQTSHPEESFSQRTSGMTYTPSGSTSTSGVRNANDVRQAVAATSVTTNTSSSRSAQAANKTTTTSTSGSSRSAASTASSTTTSSSRNTSATNSSTSSRNTTAAATTETQPKRETTTTTTRTSSTTTSSSPSRSTTTTKTTTTTSRSATSSATVQPSRTTSTTSKVNSEGRVRSTSTTRTTVESTQRSAASASSSRSAATEGSAASSRSAASTSTSRSSR